MSKTTRFTYTSAIPFRKTLCPAFLNASRRHKTRGYVENILKMTETVRKSVLMPARKDLDSIKITHKANDNMRDADAKNITIQTDRQCESLLNSQLKQQYPNALIIGEEMFGDMTPAEKRVLLQQAMMETDRPVILTDALDGTRDFRNGGDGFAVMAAVIERGETVAAVIHRCTNDACPDAIGETLTYERGDGVRLNGKKVKSLNNRNFPHDPSHLRGYAGFEFISAKHGKDSAHYPDLAADFDSLSDLWTCSKFTGDMITGRHHFALIAPPVDMFDYPAVIAIVEQSGGTARFLDGTPASFAEMVKRQSFVTGQQKPSLADTLVLAVSNEAFNAVRNTIITKRPIARKRPNFLK